jgi:hypothetical protein
MCVIFLQNAEGELLVLSMNEGGPAARSNLIKKDDILYTIDGKPSREWIVCMHVCILEGGRERERERESWFSHLIKRGALFSCTHKKVGAVITHCIFNVFFLVKVYALIHIGAHEQLKTDGQADVGCFVHDSCNTSACISMYIYRYSILLA